MKTLASSILLAAAGLLGAAAQASAAPAHDAVVVAHFGDDQHGHNYTNPNNTDRVTNQGANKGTGSLEGTMGAALGTR